MKQTSLTQAINNKTKINYDRFCSSLQLLIVLRASGLKATSSEA